MPTSVREAGSKRSHSIRRWNSRSTTKMSSPLIDRTNTHKSAYSTTTAATATSSFLPELYSTPPMPTFQKPDMPTQTPVRKANHEENVTPTRSSYIPRKPVDADSPLRVSQRAPPAARPVVTVSLQDRVAETPPLPRNWSPKHDRAICVLDARNYSLTASITKIRRTFPELHGTLTPAMVDKRLRQLDQNVEIDYWRIGLKKEEPQRENAKASPGAGAGVKAKVDSSMTLTDDAAAAPAGRSLASPTLRGGGGSSSIDVVRSLSPVDGPAGSMTSTVTTGFLSGFRSQVRV